MLDHLPERERPWVRRKLRGAWEDADHRAALAALEALARQLEVAHPGAAGSRREGLVDTLTVTRLGLRGRLKATLGSTDENVNRRGAADVADWAKGSVAERSGGPHSGFIGLSSRA